jgi:nitrogen fixation NifU-like protein
MNTNACANTLAELAEGINVKDAWAITPDDVVAYLQALPAESFHCAGMAAGAFYLALIKWQQIQRQLLSVKGKTNDKP